MRLFVFAILAYGLGSIPFGKIISKYYEVDIQKTGSGNIGFANVLRSVGKKPAIIVLVGDILKGFIPILAAKHYLPYEYQLMIIGLMAMLGHIFPVWLKFKGGKGIATGLGVTLAINFLLGLLGLGVYIITAATFKKSAIGSIFGAWSLPLFTLALAPKYILFFLGLAIFATWTHHNNIRQMIKAHAS